MSDPILAEARALRLLLSALETDEAGSAESSFRVVTEADRADGLIEVALILADMLALTVNHSPRRRELLIGIQLRLAKLLDQLRGGEMTAYSACSDCGDPTPLSRLRDGLCAECQAASRDPGN